MSNNDKDIAVSPVGLVNNVNLSKKPAYIILLCDISNKSKTYTSFISTDRPELLNGFIQVKGIYSDLPYDELIKNYNHMLTSSSKDIYCEEMLPWHRVHSIRNLIYKQK